MDERIKEEFMYDLVIIFTDVDIIYSYGDYYGKF
jgi:hypothetical protein